LSPSDSDNDKKRPDYNKNDSSSGSEKKSGTFTSLRIRNFRFLLTGQVISQGGNWIQQITVNWLVYNLTGSGTMLGTVSTIRSIMSLGMIPAAGVLTDRLNRKKLMMATNTWLFVVTLLFGLMLVFRGSQVFYLFVFAFLVSLTYTIDSTLKQVVIFDLVPRTVTPNAIALFLTGSAMMRSFGPAIGGFLLIRFGPGGNFLVQAGTYILIAITIMQLRFPARKYDSKHDSPLQNIREGVRYVVKGRVTRTFVLMGFILPIFTIPIFTVLPPIYAVKVFGDPTGRVLSILMALTGVGSMFGGVAAASISRVERRGLVQLASLFLLATSLVGFAFCSKVWTASLMLALAGFFESIFMTSNQTLLQLSIPDNLRGRVTSVVNLNAALAPVGGLLAGVGSDLLGGPKIITIIMAGTAAGIAIIVLFLSSTIRNYRLSQGIAANSIPGPLTEFLIGKKK
jgi:MFS family permease